MRTYIKQLFLGIALVLATIQAFAALTITSGTTPSESFVGQQVTFTASTTLTQANLRVKFFIKIGSAAEQQLPFVAVVNQAAQLVQTFNTGGEVTIRGTIDDPNTGLQLEAASLTHKVLKAPISVQLTVDAVASPDVATRTFRVSTNPGPGAEIASGTVAIYDLSNPDQAIATAPNPATLDAQGRSVFTATLASGSRRLYAVYFGNARYEAAVSYPFINTSVNDDTTPNAIAFADATNLAPLTPTISNTQIISGITVPINISISGGEYSTNCSAASPTFTSAAGQVRNGDTVCVRVTSACRSNEASTAALTYGSLIATFRTVVGTSSATTGDCDQDGVPDTAEATFGLNPNVKDNNIFDSTTLSYRLFVAQQYRDFLGREPKNDAEINDWVTELQSGRTTKTAVIQRFYNNTAPIFRLYQSTFQRRPDAAGLSFWGDEFVSGRRPLLEISQAFTSAPEFQNLYGNVSNSQYVNLLYQNILKRTADAAGLAFWLGELDSGRQSRGQMLNSFNESNENRLTSAREVVTAAMLQRPLSAAERALAAQSEALLIPQTFNSAEYAARFLPSAPGACQGTISFSPTTLNVLKNVSTGRATFTVTRTDANANCSAAVVLCESTDCGTTGVRNTHYTTNATNFSQSVPGRATVTFAPGETTKSVDLAIINTATIQTAPIIVKAFLRDPSFGLNLGNDVATLTIAEPSSACAFGVQADGVTCIPEPRDSNQVPIVTPPFQLGCHSEGGNNNPCRAYAVQKPAACPSSVTEVFQYAMAIPALQGERNFGSQKFYFIGRDQALIFAFRTPPQTGNGVNTAISFDNNTLGAEAIKFVTISTTPCDFSLERFQSRDLCYQAGNQTGIEIAITSTRDPARCTLQPDTTYYLNVRGENPATSSATNRAGSCPSGSCGYLMNGPTLLFPR
jgi:hypothetical protein